MKTYPLSPRRFLPHLSAALLVASTIAMPARAADAPGLIPALPSKVVSEYRHSDANADGLISLSEFKADSHHAEAFKEADGNCDGRLTPYEYSDARAIDRRLQVVSYLGDLWLTAKVKVRLLTMALPTGLGIQVSANQGAVALSGRVSDATEASRIIRVAADIDGVKTLHAQLTMES